MKGMIKETEFRIGNNLYDAVGNIGSVVISGGCFVLSTEDRGYVSMQESAPIPLTPEWLERCGFDARRAPEEPLMYSILKMDLDLAKEEDGYYLRTNNTDPYQNTNVGVRIEYLHQLQNAYFALTGEELNVKL